MGYTARGPISSRANPDKRYSRNVFTPGHPRRGRGGGETIYRGHVRGGGKRARSAAPLTRSSGLKRRRSRPRRVVSIARLRRASPAPARRTSRSLVSPIPRRNCKSPLSSFARFTLDRDRGAADSRPVDAAFETLAANSGVFHNGALSSIVDTFVSLRSSLLSFFFFLSFFLSISFPPWFHSDRLSSDR